MVIHPRKRRAWSIMIGLSVAFLWSTSWVLIKFGLHDIPSLTFAGLRYSLACVFLVPLLFLKRFRSSRSLPPRSLWPRLAALGVLLYAVTQGAMFMALSCMPAVTVNLLWSFSTIIIALLGMVFLHERQTPVQWCGVGIALAGAVLYFFPAGFQGGQFAGILVSAVGVAANVGAAIIGRSINRSGEIPPITVTIITMTIGSAMLLPVGIATQGLPPISPAGWLTILWLAVINTAMAFTLWNYTLQTLSATESSVINGTMTFWIPILAVLFLGEKPGAKEIIALVLVAAGTLAVQLRRAPSPGKVEVSRGP